MRNSYISLLLFSALLAVLIFYAPGEFSGFAIQENPFNLEVEIPSAYNTMKSGDEIHFTTKILNLASENRIDISLKYEIYFEDEKLVASKIETMAIETQASFVGSMKIPDDSEEGNYDLYVTLFVNDVEEARSRSSFKIINERNEVMYYTYIAIASIAAFALVVFVLKRSKVILEKHKTKSKIRDMIKKKLGKS